MKHAGEAVLTAILETAVDAIILIDQQGIIRSVNPATVTMFGFSKEEMVGNNVKMLMPSPDRERHDQYLQNYCQTGVAKIIGIGREVAGQRKDGTAFPMHLAVSEIPVQDGRLFAGIIRDITALKAAQDELTMLNEDLERMVRQRTDELRAAQAELLQQERLATLGQVSGGIAHEIRNPLNAVKTSAYYLLNANSPAPEKVREHLERIDRQVTLIDNVITALTDVARMPEPTVGRCDVHALVASIAATISMDVNIKLIDRIPSNLPTVHVDANQLSIVFRNLIRNARDAMPKGGTIFLDATSDERTVSMRVSDTGPGIPPELLSRVMEPLFTTKARGMGLGLAISKAILQRNGGTISADNQSGSGAVFTVTLPIGVIGDGVAG
ncbi:PAS domain S-box protein [Stieleria varia]|uniref:Sensor protein FixL n=2 Tax=Stieleria varia TaxID=2528005 RepID=A0A5C6ASF1_9BACT|nr:Sensor protein FixL [Stieleria varia]